MTSPARTPLIDWLKVGAAQLIVLHHLAFYGPLSDVVHLRWPFFVEWLYDHGRLAVQVFLVIGGFLTALSLAPHGVPRRIEPLKLVAQRYLRLAPPYAVALLIAIGSAAVARTLMQQDSIPAEPTLGQFLAHLLLLQDVLGVDALSAGVWYVAIDFQLFIMMMACAWLAQQLSRRGPLSRLSRNHHVVLPLLVCSLALASLVYVNRLAHWDHSGLYFFGAYALGALACWAAQARAAWWMAGLLVIGLLAQLVEARTRIGVATVTALVLGLAYRHHVGTRRSPSPRLSLAGSSSYAVFLVHFPVCMLVNAFFHHVAPHSLWSSVAGLALAWALSNLTGLLFHVHVEQRINRGIARLSRAPWRALPIPALLLPSKPSCSFHEPR